MGCLAEASCQEGGLDIDGCDEHREDVQDTI